MMQQWMLRITAYAERLLDDLDGSTGPRASRRCSATGSASRSAPRSPSPSPTTTPSFQVFTTRPDTLFGAPTASSSPEHPLVARITTEQQRAAVRGLRAARRPQRPRARAGADEAKTGVFTGAFALHPVTGERLPIWIADYVLMSYGTGAIMAVPAHDERDHAFAKHFGLPIVEVVSGGAVSVQEAAHAGDGARSTRSSSTASTSRRPRRA